MKKEKHEGRPQSGPFDLQEVLTVLENDLEKHWGFPSGSLRQGSISHLTSNDNRAAWTANGGVVACADAKLGEKIATMIRAHDDSSHTSLLVALRNALKERVGDLAYCYLDICLYGTGRSGRKAPKYSDLVEILPAESIWPEGNECVEHVFAIRRDRIPFPRHAGPMIIPKDSAVVSSGMAAIAPLNVPSLQTGRHRLRVASVATHSDYWKRGLGKAVVFALLQHIADEGDIALWNCNVMNTPSYRLARSVGFAEHVLIFKWRPKRSLPETAQVRMAAPSDLDACLKLRSDWLQIFHSARPVAADNWCPAGVPVPQIENEEILRKHLAREGDCWAAILADEQEAYAYILCREDENKKKLLIEQQGPRISPYFRFNEAGDPLLTFALQQAKEKGLEGVSVFLHGFPEEVEPLTNLYSGHGFKGRDQLRYEMLSRQLKIDPGQHEITFRSADEIGLDAFYEVEALVKGISCVNDVKKDCEFSRKMWSVEPGKDWLAAYEKGQPIGTIRMAVTHDGVGVLDDISVKQTSRERGIGRVLLSHGLASLDGRTEVVWLDTDQDNLAARRLYEWAGFKVHHIHGDLMLHPAK